ncbi:DUF86 domain-containing protein [Candidatus Parcubacteria bacterium]|nr:DUF86 domain-containing protein [Candidatus Parcubacteria bacterium]
MISFAQKKILEKLENYKEYLNYLHQLQKEAEDESLFVSDFHLFGNTERYLQSSVQIIIDISHLIIIDLGLKRPEDNYEAISLLFQNKVVSEDLAEKITRMIGLRNILVHEYGKIDRKEIYKILKEELSDLEEFEKQAVEFLKR